MSSSYEDFQYEIEKQLTVEDHKNIKNWSLKGYYFYVLLNHEHKFRIAYATTHKYPVGRKYVGRQLNFVPIDIYGTEKKEVKYTDELVIIKNNKIIFKKDKGSMGEDYVNIEQGFEGDSFASLFMKIKEKADGTVDVINQHNIHLKKIAIDRKDWFIDEIKKKNVSNLSKKIIKEIMQDTKTDQRMLKLVKTQFFEFEDNHNMHLQTHALTLTQGATGKSSILGVNGVVKQKNSDAGIFGYFNTSANAWISGAVSQTQKCIIIDEINEILNSTTAKGEDFMSSINSALENGTYSYGKAGGRQITFGNQFIFCANISESFNFDSFVNGVATNTETIGRRFCYLVYDHKLLFEKGKKRRPTKQTETAIIVSSYVSYLWHYFVNKRKFIEKTFNKKLIKSIETKYIVKIHKILNSGEFEGRDSAKKFLRSYVDSSVGSRLKNMALKLAIFNNLNYFLNIEKSYVFKPCKLNYKNNYKFNLLDQNKNIMFIKSHSTKKDLNQENHSIIYDSFIHEYQEVLEDTVATIQNIMKDFSHTENLDFNKVSMQRQYNNLSKSEKSILTMIFENDALFNNNKLHVKDIANVGNNRHMLKHWKNGTGIKKNFKNISYFGVLPIVSKGEIYFVIQNPKQYEKSMDNLFEGVSTFDMSSDDQDQTINVESKKTAKDTFLQIEDSDI